MKRYIKASFSDSMPAWLKKRLEGTKDFQNASLRNNLFKKYGIALDRANFSSDKTENSIPIYLIDGSYYDAVYIPGVNDDDVTVRVNGRDRKIGNVAKSRLPEYVKDVVYVDISDSANTFDKKKERYRDPRYSYGKYDQRGSYAGQYKMREYIGQGKYSDEYEWSTKGKTPSNESKARDKSGYRIPSPESMIREFYTRFPEKLTDKVENVYLQIIETRNRILDVDFKSPVEYGSKFENSYRYLGDAIDAYRQLLHKVNAVTTGESRRYLTNDDWYMNELSGLISTIKSRLRDAEEAANKGR